MVYGDLQRLASIFSSNGGVRYLPNHSTIDLGDWGSWVQIPPPRPANAKNHSGLAGPGQDSPSGVLPSGSTGGANRNQPRMAGDFSGRIGAMNQAAQGQRHHVGNVIVGKPALQLQHCPNAFQENSARSGSSVAAAVITVCKLHVVQADHAIAGYLVPNSGQTTHAPWHLSTALSSGPVALQTEKISARSAGKRFAASSRGPQM
jgi:hypothetical protein